MKPNPVTKSCAVCGQPFTRRASLAAKLTTCGAPECRAATRSRNVANVYRHNPQREPWNTGRTSRVPVECACGCGAVFDIPPNRAEANKRGVYFVNAQHFYDWNRGRNHVNFRGGPFPYGEGWPQIADAIRQRDRVCRRCGKTPEANGRALDVHHVVPFRASRDNSPENLVALCMICHREVTRLEEIEYAPYYATPRACLVCGSDFYPENPRVKLCSPACVRERQRERGRARDHRRSTRKTEYMRRWRAQNREHVNAYARQRKARRRQAQTGPDQTP